MTQDYDQHYGQRIDRVMRHIRLNLAGDLSLDTLAGVAALSRFHFHRMFRAMQGETVAEAVRRTRLNHAAQLVSTTALPMARVAAACGYPNVQSFTRAFRAAFDAAPRTVRLFGQMPKPVLPKDQGIIPMHPVQIETHPARPVLALLHTGPYAAIGPTFDRLGAAIAHHGLGPAIAGPGVGIYHDDPETTPQQQLRAHAGVVVAAGTAPPDGLEALNLPGGRVAVLTLKGPYAGIAAAWSWLYGHWVPASGEEPADQPAYELYPNGPADTAPPDLVTLVCVPLRG